MSNKRYRTRGIEAKEAELKYRSKGIEVVSTSLEYSSKGIEAMAPNICNPSYGRIDMVFETKVLNFITLWLKLSKGCSEDLLRADHGCGVVSW